MGEDLEANMESESHNENKDIENTSNNCSSQKDIDFCIKWLGQEQLLTETFIDYLLQESDCGANNFKDDHFIEDVVQDTSKHLIGDSRNSEKDNLFSLFSTESIFKEDTRKGSSKEPSNLKEEGLCLSDVKEQKEEWSFVEKKVSIVGTKALDPIEIKEDLKHLEGRENEKNELTLLFKGKGKRKQGFNFIFRN